MGKVQPHTGRALKYARDILGWEAYKVERWAGVPGSHGKRVDAFGFGDLLVISPCVSYEDECRIGLIQVGSRNGISAHRRKMEKGNLRAIDSWLCAGGFIELWGFDQPKGPRTKWRLKRMDVAARTNAGLELVEVAR